MSENPCVSCGACCAHFRVSFYWGEADDAPGGIVPVALTESVNLHSRCMKGTNGRVQRCIALSGEIGKQVACTIYDLRPSPCREFDLYEPDGTVNPRCQKLRASIGLSWPVPEPAVVVTAIQIPPGEIPAIEIPSGLIPAIEITAQLLAAPLAPRVESR